MNLPEKETVKPNLTREQRRMKDRIEKDAVKTLRGLNDKFFDLFMDSNDPIGPELTETKKVMSSKWKMYCAKQKLIPEAYTQFDTYADKLINDFKATKEAN